MQIGVVALPKFQHTFDPGLALPGQTVLPGRVSQFQVVGVPPAKAWLVRSTRHIEGKMRVAAVMTAPGFDPRRTAIVTGQGAFNLSDIGGVRGTVTLLDLSETWARMRVDAGSKPAYLVYSSTAYPGWLGRIDGKTIQPVRTDGAFLGLPIPPGKHEVAFEYRPSACRLGGFLSLIATCLCVAMGVKIALERLRGGIGWVTTRRSRNEDEVDELGEELTDNG